MTTTPIDTVLYDLGNVLIGWDPYQAYTGHMNRDEVEQFFTDIDFPEFNHAQDAGRPWADARAALAGTHPHHVGAVDLYLENFEASLTGPIAGSEELVRELKAKGVRLFGLSNWSAETFHHAIPAAPAISLLDDVLVSGSIGIAKPDPRIYEVAIRQFALVPEQTVFVDDSAANIAAAAALGFRTHLFTDTCSLRAELGRLGVLAA